MRCKTCGAESNDSAYIECLLPGCPYRAKWDALQKRKQEMIQFADYNYLKGPFGARFEFDGDGNLTVTESNGAISFYRPAGKPKTFVHAAELYANAAEVVAGVEKLSGEGWHVAAGWIVPTTPPKIQIIFKRENPQL